MSRIPTPATVEGAPLASQAGLAAVKKQLGVVPNLFRLGLQQPGHPRRVSRPVRCSG